MTADYFEPGYLAGGPIRSVSSLMDAASPAIEGTLVTRDHDLGAPESFPGLSGRWVQRGRHRVFYLGARRLRHWRRLYRELRATRFDLLYVNSLWSLFSIVPIVAAKTGALRVERVLIAPRGECGVGALSINSTRKRIFLVGWRWMLNGQRVYWHATTALEAADIRRVVPSARIPVVVGAGGPEPVDLPPARSSGPARLVFLGRISPMKNLDLVLTALSEVKGPVEFDIFGPTEDQAYWRTCLSLLESLPGNIRATYRGAVQPDQVCDVFAGHDAFVLPTRGENFGHVIAESLAVGCPVICSDRTPWTPVLRSGGGMVLPDLTAEALRDCIEEFVAASPEQRHAARMAASAAYRDWRQQVGRPSVLDRAREALVLRALRHHAPIVAHRGSGSGLATDGARSGR
ncbi:glycosyltransferase, partial [Micromonospora profundi]|uniref:glycosyltransferase n=1 Tax=Micromonospora profundi TaxID=1420889 RepID=UPI0033A42A8E